MTSKLMAIQVTLSAGAPVRLRHRKYASLPVSPPPLHSQGIGVALVSLTPSLPASSSQGACASFLTSSQGRRVRLRPSGQAAGSRHRNFSTHGADSALLHLRTWLPSAWNLSNCFTLAAQTPPAAGSLPFTILSPSLLALPVFTPPFHS